MPHCSKVQFKGAAVREVINAHAWGLKAASEGLAISDNPYGNAQARSAWEMGFREAHREHLASLVRDEQVCVSRPHEAR